MTKKNHETLLGKLRVLLSDAEDHASCSTSEYLLGRAHAYEEAVRLLEAYSK